MSKKHTENDIQAMFKEGNLIARALYVGGLKQTPEGKVGYDLSEFNKEMQFLYTERKKDGIHNNIERSGQRNRSATLLVPEVPMDLFSGIGLLYDADKSTIRGYMYHDSATMSGMKHQPEKFFNINEDKAKFEPIISKREFLAKYKDYREQTDNTPQANTEYNEVLANFFPESITGLVAKDSSDENKLKLLEAKQLFSEKHGLDLPMVIMDDGKVNTWTPGIEEVSQLLSSSKVSIKNLSIKTGKPKEKLLQNFCNNLGFGVEVKDFLQDIKPQDIKVLNKHELTSRELIGFIHKVTGIPEGGKFSYGITGRLKEVVNQRLEGEGLKKVSNLKNLILNKQDIKNLANVLQKEIAVKNPKHQKMNESELSNFSDLIMKQLQDNRTNSKSQKEFSVDDIKNTLSKHIPGNVFSKIKEFFNKVASLFDEKLISTKIERNKNMRECSRAVR